MSQGTFEFKNEKPFIDWFSLGHWLFGAVVYFIIFYFTEDPILSLLLVLIVGILWEFFENFLLDINMIYEKKRDSVANVLSDLVFDILGGFTLALIPNPYAIYLLIASSIGFGILYIFKKMDQRRKIFTPI